MGKYPGLIRKWKNISHKDVFFLSKIGLIALHLSDNTVLII
jgi:hypothetical protein